MPHFIHDHLSDFFHPFFLLGWPDEVKHRHSSLRFLPRGRQANYPRQLLRKIEVLRELPVLFVLVQVIENAEKSLQRKRASPSLKRITALSLVKINTFQPNLRTSTISGHSARSYLRSLEYPIALSNSRLAASVPTVFFEHLLFKIKSNLQNIAVASFQLS